MGSILPKLPSHGVGHHFGTKRLDIAAMAVLKLDQAWLAGMVLDIKGCPSQEVILAKATLVRSPGTRSRKPGGGEFQITFRT
jgi:hypothetical protein